MVNLDSTQMPISPTSVSNICMSCTSLPSKRQHHDQVLLAKPGLVDKLKDGQNGLSMSTRLGESTYGGGIYKGLLGLWGENCGSSTYISVLVNVSCVVRMVPSGLRIALQENGLVAHGTKSFNCSNWKGRRNYFYHFL